MRALLPFLALLTVTGPVPAQDNPLLLRPDQFQTAPQSPLEQERARSYRDQLLIDRGPLQNDQNAGRIDPLGQRDLRSLTLEQQRMDEVVSRPARAATGTPGEAEIRQNLQPDPPLAGSQHRPAPASSGRPGKQPRPAKPPTQQEIDEVYGRK